MVLRVFTRGNAGFMTFFVSHQTVLHISFLLTKERSSIGTIQTSQNTDA
jgi:hypothetical protein